MPLVILKAFGYCHRGSSCDIVTIEIKKYERHRRNPWWLTFHDARDLAGIISVGMHMSASRFCEFVNDQGLPTMYVNDSIGQI